MFAFIDLVCLCMFTFVWLLFHMELSIVLPCFNEEPNVENTVRDVAKWFEKEGIDGEIIAVNDGSGDKTGDIIDMLVEEIPYVHSVNHKENLGYGASVRDGCDFAKKKYIGFMDSDGQFLAEEINALLPNLSDYRIVAGVRTKRADPWNRKLNAWLYGRLVRIVLGVKKRDINCSLVVFEKSLWPTIRPMYATGALFCGEMYHRLKNAGVPLSQIGVDHYPCEEGVQTGANPFVILRMFKELFVLKKNIRSETPS